MTLAINPSSIGWYNEVQQADAWKLLLGGAVKAVEFYADEVNNGYGVIYYLKSGRTVNKFFS